MWEGRSFVPRESCPDRRLSFTLGHRMVGCAESVPAWGQPGLGSKSRLPFTSFWTRASPLSSLSLFPVHGGYSLGITCVKHLAAHSWRSGTIVTTVVIVLVDALPGAVNTGNAHNRPTLLHVHQLF